jgi:glutaredoxin-like protein NrdH
MKGKNMVTVYSKTNCQKCKATKRKLQALHVDYQEVNVEDAPETRQKLLGMGFREMPVVDADGSMWSGYRIDKIAALA